MRDRVDTSGAPKFSHSPELLRHRASAFGARYDLTTRQVEVLLALLDGVDVKAVGGRIGCGHSSVRTHLRRMAQKLGCSTTREIVIRFFSDDIA